jgi:hypothetical protein
MVHTLLKNLRGHMPLLVPTVKLIGLVFFVQTTFAQQNVSLEISDARLGSDSALSLKWKLANHSPRRYYVFSTHLRGSSEYYRLSSDGRLDIYTTLVKPEHFYPYVVTPAKFEDLKEGAEIIGEHHESLDPKDVSKIRSIRLFIGYGRDLDSIQSAMNKAINNTAGDYPDNPVIRWQHIATSNVLPIERR